MSGTVTISLLSLVALTYWVVGLLKDATPPFNANGVVTRASAFLGAFAIVALVAHTRWATGVQLDNSTTLHGLNLAEQAMVALSLAAGGGVTNDALRAVNRNDTSTLPILIGDKPAAPVVNPVPVANPGITTPITTDP